MEKNSLVIALALLGVFAPGCAGHNDDRSAQNLASVRAVACDEATQLPQRLMTHLDTALHWREELKAGGKSAQTACTDLMQKAGENCGTLGEYHRIVASSETALGLRIDPSAADPFGTDLCNQLLLATYECALNPATGPQKLMTAIDAFPGELTKRLQAVTAGCAAPPKAK